MVNSTYFQFVNVGSNPTLPMKKGYMDWLVLFKENAPIAQLVRATCF